MRIDILVFAGFDELDAIGPLEVLRNAAALGAEFDVRVVRRRRGPMKWWPCMGCEYCAEAGMRDGPRPDVIVVPGGGWGDRRPEGRGPRRHAVRFPSFWWNCMPRNDRCVGVHGRDAAGDRGTAPRPTGHHASCGLRRPRGGGCEADA